jgi:hypothetical protein
LNVDQGTKSDINDFAVRPTIYGVKALNFKILKLAQTRFALLAFLDLTILHTKK